MNVEVAGKKEATPETVEEPDAHRSVSEKSMPPLVEVFLRHPLYKLYYLDDVEGFSGLSVEERDLFMQQYEDPLRSSILDALKWANEHPEADLTNVLPGLPCSNSDIHCYVGRVLASLEDGGEVGGLGRSLARKL
jgi:hypothetical protein